MVMDTLLKTAVYARDLEEKIRASEGRKQSLVSALYCNRSPDWKKIYTKCASDEYVTRVHIQRCMYLQKQVKKFDRQRIAKETWKLMKMLKTAIKLIQN